MAFVAVTFSLGCATGCAPVIAPARGDLIRITNSESADVTVERTADGALIQIDSPKGIGFAGFQLDEQTELTSIQIRLYLLGLEHLELRYADVAIHGHQSTASAKPIQTVETVSGSSDKPISESSPYWIDLQYVAQSHDRQSEKAEDYYQMNLPADFFREENRQFDLSWIDFYR